MAGQPTPYAVTAATFAGMSADDYPDGQRVTVTDDGEREYEARGADGARAWVELHTAHVTDHEAAYDHSLIGQGDVWMPLTSVVSGAVVLVIDADNSLVPTKVPTE